MTNNYETLTNEDKVGLINDRIKTIEYQMFGAEMIIAEQNAINTPDQKIIDASNAKITDFQSQVAALVEQKNALSDTITQ